MKHLTVLATPNCLINITKVNIHISIQIVKYTNFKFLSSKILN